MRKNLSMWRQWFGVNVGVQLRAALLNLLLTGLGLMLVLHPVVGHAKNFTETPAGVSSVLAAELPKQGRETLALIFRGGPFEHHKDGVVFGNRERLLPVMVRTYYREYTVRTPGAKNRGARRIVCGGLVPAQPEVCYYTSDHYASFRKIIR